MRRSAASERRLLCFGQEALGWLTWLADLASRAEGFDLVDWAVGGGGGGGGGCHPPPTPPPQILLSCCSCRGGLEQQLCKFGEGGLGGVEQKAMQGMGRCQDTVPTLFLRPNRFCGICSQKQGVEALRLGVSLRLAIREEAKANPSAAHSKFQLMSSSKARQFEPCLLGWVEEVALCSKLLVSTSAHLIGQLGTWCSGITPA